MAQLLISLEEAVPINWVSKETGERGHDETWHQAAAELYGRMTGREQLL